MIPELARRNVWEVEGTELGVVQTVDGEGAVALHFRYMDATVRMRFKEVTAKSV